MKEKITEIHLGRQENGNFIRLKEYKDKWYLVTYDKDNKVIDFGEVKMNC